MGYPRTVHYAATIALIAPQALLAQTITTCQQAGSLVQCTSNTPTPITPPPSLQPMYDRLLDAGAASAAAFANGQRVVEARRAQKQAEQNNIDQSNANYSAAVSGQLRDDARVQIRQMIAAGQCDRAVRLARYYGQAVFDEAYHACEK